MLGNVRRFLTPQILTDYDVFSGLGHEYTWRPFTLYHNTSLINQLFCHTQHPLPELFDTNEVLSFDEWGGVKDRHYNSTMSGIVEHQWNHLGIQWTGGIPHVWDGGCMKQKKELKGVVVAIHFICQTHQHCKNTTISNNNNNSLFLWAAVNRKCTLPFSVNQAGYGAVTS